MSEKSNSQRSPRATFGYFKGSNLLLIGLCLVPINRLIQFIIRIQRCAPVISFLFARQVEKIIVCIIVRRRAHVFLAQAAGGRNYIGVRPNFNLDRAWFPFQEVMKGLLLKKARIIAAFDVDGVDFQEIAGVVTARFHFYLCRVHNATLPFSAKCGHHWLLGISIQNSQKKNSATRDKSTS